MSANALAAEILEASIQGFARQANLKFHEQLASGGLELTENLPAWQAHLQQRIVELAAALRAGQPILFAEKMLWLRKAYAARGVSAAVPRAVLESLSATVADALPDDAANAVREVIDAGFDALESPKDTFDTALNPADSGDALALKFVAMCMDGDSVAATSMILDAIDQGLSPQDAILKVLLPAQREIGDLWHRNDASISQEHLVTNTTSDLLAILGHKFATETSDARKVMTATVSGNVHDIGIRAANLLFGLAGWKTFYLGTDLPPNEIAGAADYFGADVVVLSATIATHVDAVNRSVQSLLATTVNPRIIVGGAVFETAPDLWQHVGADALCSRIDDVVEVASSLLAE
jgi:methanogenic corrinoid protein MtbC1